MIDNDCFFSIIIPVYNVAEFLCKCVDSVIAQSYSNFELLLIDDGSTDGSGSICEEYAQKDARVHVIHQINSGASSARNNGLNNAIGDYVIFLDSDDYWNSVDALMEISVNIEKLKSDVVVFGCTDFNMNNGISFISRNNYDVEYINSVSNEDILHYFFSKKLLPGASWLFAFKRSIAIENKIYFKVGIQDEDYDFVMSIFINSNKVSAINNPFYMYRKGRETSVTGASDLKMIYGIDYTVKKWIPLSKNIENKQLRRDLLNYVAFIYSTGFVICGRLSAEKRKEALDIMKKHKKVLKYAYWKKTKLTYYLVNLLGMKIFSIFAARYFDKTHIF